MENKKLGMIFIIFSLIFLGFLIYFGISLNQEAEMLGCSLADGCSGVQQSLGITHVGFGFFGFMFALGFYMIFFNKTEEIILKKLEDDKNKKISDEKFEIILSVVGEYEKRVLKAVREQEGITQNTLKLRTDMSKAKLSYVLQELEKRNIIKKVGKGKTFEIYLKI